MRVLGHRSVDAARVLVHVCLEDSVLTAADAIRKCVALTVQKCIATDEGAHPLITSFDRSLCSNRRDLAGSLKLGFERKDAEDNARRSVAVVAYLTGTAYAESVALMPQSIKA